MLTADQLFLRLLHRLLFFARARSVVLAGADIVQLCLANFWSFHDFQLYDIWSVQWVNTLYPYSAGKLAHREGSIHTSPTLAGNNEAFKNLYTLFAAFANFLVHLDGITNAEGWKLAELCFFSMLNDGHIQNFQFLIFPCVMNEIIQNWIKIKNCKIKNY